MNKIVWTLCVFFFSDVAISVFFFFPGWNSDIASILLLLHLIPPSPQGRKRPGKMSASQAEKHLIIFKKVICSLLSLPVVCLNSVYVWANCVVKN